MRALLLGIELLTEKRTQKHSTKIKHNLIPKILNLRPIIEIKSDRVRETCEPQNHTKL